MCDDNDNMNFLVCALAHALRFIYSAYCCFILSNISLFHKILSVDFIYFLVLSLKCVLFQQLFKHISLEVLESLNIPRSVHVSWMPIKMMLASLSLKIKKNNYKEINEVQKVIQGFVSGTKKTEHKIERDYANFTGMALILMLRQLGILGSTESSIAKYWIQYIF